MPFSSWEGVIDSILSLCSFVRKWLSEDRDKTEIAGGLLGEDQGGVVEELGHKDKAKKSQVSSGRAGSAGISPLTLRFFFSCQVGTNTVISRCPRFQKYCTAMAMPRHEKKCCRPCLWDGRNEGTTSQKTLLHYSSPALLPLLFSYFSLDVKMKEGFGVA